MLSSTIKEKPKPTYTNTKTFVQKFDETYTNRGTLVRRFDDKPLDPLVTCYKFCGYSWYSRSKLQKVQCPNCHRLIDRLKLVVQGQDQSQDNQKGQNK